MAEITTLREAVNALVPDGSQVAMEGFTHLIPFAAGLEVARQGRQRLHLVRMTPDLIYDQLIGIGCARNSPSRSNMPRTMALRCVPRLSLCLFPSFPPTKVSSVAQAQS